jgi:hypothetical protein
MNPIRDNSRSTAAFGGIKLPPADTPSRPRRKSVSFSNGVKIKISYSGKSLQFRLDSKKGVSSGEGIAALLKRLEKSKEKIASVELSGESQSFTFSRQVYLLANLLSHLSGAPLIISGKRSNAIATPAYSVDCLQ